MRALPPIAALLAASTLVLASGCGGGGGGPPSTQDSIATLLQSSDPAERAQAANRLALALSPAVVRQVVREAPANARGRTATRLLRARLLRLHARAVNRPARRARAIAALAGFDDAPARAVVLRAVERDSDHGVRLAAISALGQIRGATPARVAGWLASAYNGARARASADIEAALVGVGQPAVPVLFSRLSVEPWARRVVGQIGPPAVPFLRIRFTRGSFAQKVAASYGVLAIGKRHPEATRRLVPVILATMMQALGGRSESQRSTAIEVLPLVGRPAVDALVRVLRKDYTSLSAVEKKQAEWGDFVLAQTAVANSKATAHLFAALRTGDYGLVADLHQFFIQIGRPGTEPLLIKALDAQGDTIMALDFLNSGNRKLDQGARDWAASHGYTVTERPGQGPPPSWGTADESTVVP